MEHYLHLFEFICKLIDIQIKKYLELTRIGVGPDAGMNAQLVLDQVEELLPLLSLILNKLKEKRDSYPRDFQHYYSLVKFYLEHEYIRGYAAWLIDENNIHSPEFSRLNEQRGILDTIGRAAGISTNVLLIANSETQKQCEHDSYAISYLVLDIALKVLKDPQISLGDSIPKHATSIIRKHAIDPNGRYHKPEIINAIRELHTKCFQFLTQSVLTKSAAKLSSQSALLKAKCHKEILQACLQELKAIHPQSKIFSGTYQWYDVGSFQASTTALTPGKSTFAYWAPRITASIAICILIYLVCNQITNSGDTFEYKARP